MAFAIVEHEKDEAQHHQPLPRCVRLVHRRTDGMLQNLSRHSDTVLQPSNTVSTIMAGTTKTGTRSAAHHDESHTEHQLAEFHADRPRTHVRTY